MRQPEENTVSVRYLINRASVIKSAIYGLYVIYILVKRRVASRL